MFSVGKNKQKRLEREAARERSLQAGIAFNREREARERMADQMAMTAEMIKQQKIIDQIVDAEEQERQKHVYKAMRQPSWQIEGSRSRTVERHPYSSEDSGDEYRRAENDREHDIAYRGENLNDEQLQRRMQQGITPKGNADITPYTHITQTLPDTPYVSLTRSLKPASVFATNTYGSLKERKRAPGKIMEIDLRPILESEDRVPIYDLNNEKTFSDQGLYNNYHTGLNARRAQEVLVKGAIQPKNILGHYNVDLINDEDEYRKIKKENNKDLFGKSFSYNPDIHERYSYQYHQNPMQQPMAASAASSSYAKGGKVEHKNKRQMLEDLMR